MSGELVQDGAGILAKAAWPAKADGERLRYSVALLKVTIVSHAADIAGGLPYGLSELD